MFMLSEKYLADAKELLSKGDVSQASEKFWKWGMSVPSKIHNIQLVKIQPEERLAAIAIRYAAVLCSSKRQDILFQKMTSGLLRYV